MICTESVNVIEWVGPIIFRKVVLLMLSKDRVERTFKSNIRRKMYVECCGNLL